MNLRAGLIVACGLLFLAPSSPAEEPGAANPNKETLWLIPHTHWEGAVFKTREEYLDMGLPNILTAMRLLREQPGFRFTLDQVAYVRPFLERYPSEVADFRRFLAEGRLQLAGALDVMPDDNMPGGETFIRQMQYGKGYYRDKLGVNVTTGWLLDTFGHHAQIPQLLTLGGYKSFWFFRGVPRQDHPSEFFWEGLDGTRIAAYWLPHGYGLFYPNSKDSSAFHREAEARFNALTANSRGGHDRVGLSGADVSEPEEHLVPLVEAFNKDPKAPFTIKMAVPADFEAVVARRNDRPVFKGELNPIFQGIYSSRIELKNWMRVMERQLLTAEKLSTIAAWLGSPADPESILGAWEPVLFNQTHDLASGVMTDHVYDDTIRSYEYAKRRSGEIIDSRWEVMASRIDTRGPGAPVVVFNPLGWTRSDIAEVEIGFGEGGVRGVVVTGPDGKTEPVQILEASRYPDTSVKTARIAFVARDLPAMGYATYHIAPLRGLGSAWPDLSAREALENDRYRLALDPLSGAMTSLRVKSSDWEALSGPGNVVARQQDRGDLWEPYKGLDGGSRIAMTNKQPVPKRGEAVFSDEGKGRSGSWRNGPVLSEFEVTRPFGTGQFATRVRLYKTLRRIEVTTRLVNNEKYVRYQVLFPTTIAEGKNTHEIPFGAIERPDAIEFPAQNWVDYGDGHHGLTLLNIGLPGNLVNAGTMIISLLRAHTLGAYGFGGGYEPGMSSDTGFQLGRERVVRYALVPHTGDWREAGVFRDGLEFNHPLICRKVLPHPGPLPARWGLLEISNPGVVVSALKPARDGDAVLRIYEAAGATGRRREDQAERQGQFGACGQSTGRPGGHADGRGRRPHARLTAFPDPDCPHATWRPLSLCRFGSNHEERHITTRFPQGLDDGCCRQRDGFTYGSAAESAEPSEPPGSRSAIRVVVWDEQQPAQKAAYPNFLGNQIAAHLREQPGLSVKSARLDDPGQGLAGDALENCQVLIWWGHVRQAEIAPETGKAIVQRIKAGRLALIALHSAHWSTPFVEAMNERARIDAKKVLEAQSGKDRVEVVEATPPRRYTVPRADEQVTPYLAWRKFPGSVVKATLHLPYCCFPAYRGDGKPSSLRVLNPDHPIAAGIPAKFELPHTEMYDEPFHVPEPDEVILEERWETGEWFRSGALWTIGRGKVFYFRPGHETYAIYKEPFPLKILTNAVRWLGSSE